jgi:hypothetical protein
MAKRLRRVSEWASKAKEQAGKLMLFRYLVFFLLLVLTLVEIPVESQNIICQRSSEFEGQG